MFLYIKNFFSKTSIIISSFCYKIGSRIASLLGYTPPQPSSIIDEEKENLRAQLRAARLENTALQQHNIVLDAEKTGAERALNVMSAALREAELSAETAAERVNNQERAYAAEVQGLTLRIQHEQRAVIALISEIEQLRMLNVHLQAQRRSQARDATAVQLELNRQLAESEQNAAGLRLTVDQLRASLERSEAQAQASHHRAEELAEENGRLSGQVNAFREQLRNPRRQAQSARALTDGAYRPGFKNFRFHLSGALVYPGALGLESALRFPYAAALGGHPFRTTGAGPALAQESSYESLVGHNMDSPYEAGAVRMDLSHIETAKKYSFSFGEYAPRNVAIYSLPACMFALSFFTREGQLAQDVVASVTPILGTFAKMLTSLPVQFSKYGIDVQIGGVASSRDLVKNAPVLVLFSLVASSSSPVRLRK